MLKRKIVGRILTAPDLETHVSTVDVAGSKMLDLRQFIPSLNEHGRGVTLPLETKDALIDALKKVK